MTGIVLALGFLAGVLLHDSGAGPVVAIPIGAAALLAMILTRTWMERVLIALALVLTVLGAFRAGATSAGSAPIVAVLNGSDRYVQATISGIPTTAATRTEARIRINGVSHRTIAASLPILPPVSQGDTIRFWAPTSWDASTPGEVVIPVSRRGDVYIPAFEIVMTGGSEASHVRTRFNRFTTDAIQRNVPEPAGSLTLGIMTGDDSGMTSATRASFRSAGMSHITAVSGWNVAIVAGLIALFARRLAPANVVTTVAAISFVWLYAFLVGMEPSVIRAAGMFSVLLVAHWRGRPGDLLTSLLLTTSVVIAVTPDIRFDIGFQLSVAATLGIVLLLELSDARSWWHSALAVPVVAELAVAPILLHHLGTYSLLSPIANLVTAPLVELVMFGGIATVIGSALHPAAGALFGALTWIPARVIIGVAERTASVSWTSSTTLRLGWSPTLLVYLAMLAAYFIWMRGRGDRRLSPQPESDNLDI